MSFKASYASSKASRASVIVSSFFSSAPSFSYCSIIFARDAFNVLRLFVSCKRRLSLFSDESNFYDFCHNHPPCPVIICVYSHCSCTYYSIYLFVFPDKCASIPYTLPAAFHRHHSQPSYYGQLHIIHFILIKYVFYLYIYVKRV